MNLYITSAISEGRWAGHADGWLREAARRDVHGQHHLADDPHTADAILFMEGHLIDDLLMERALWHPLRRRYPEKCFLYQDGDDAFALMRGVYPSIRTPHVRPHLATGGVYLARIEENKAVQRGRELKVEQDLLYSFVGANNCEVRNRILKAQVPGTHVLDTSARHSWLLSAEERAAYESEYATICARSRFMLSPRGLGPSTYRLYEAMEMGRCPVILADEWVPPPFIPWSEFSIRVPENQVDQLPRLLADLPYEALGRAARKAWEDYIDGPHCFHYLAESLRLLMEQPYKPNLPARYAALLRSDMRELYLRSKFRIAKRRMLSVLRPRPA
ncbi:MAG: exostosin family protein [Proteobacteria bacterium]|nr:exostosin family protein [Pseudomonadota bacterium]